MWKVNFIYSNSNKVFIPKKDSICILTNNAIERSISYSPYNDYLYLDDLSYFHRFNSDKYNLVFSIMIGKDDGTNLVVSVKGLYTDAINLHTNISSRVSLSTNGILYEIDKYALARLKLSSGGSTLKSGILDYIKMNDNLVSVFDIRSVAKPVVIKSKGLFSSFKLPSNLIYELTLSIDTSGKINLSRGSNRFLIKSYGNSYFLGSATKYINYGNETMVDIDELDNLIYSIILDYFNIEPIDNSFLLGRLDSLLIECKNTGK